MRENKFRVWCEFEFEGELVKEIAGPESWFLLTQTGKLMTHGPTEPLRPAETEYIKAIPLFYTRYKDKNEKEIYEDDILILRHKDGKIVCEDFVVRNFIQDGYALRDDIYIKEVIGNKRENPELLEAKK